MSVGRYDHQAEETVSWCLGHRRIVVVLRDYLRQGKALVPTLQLYPRLAAGRSGIPRSNPAPRLQPALGQDLRGLQAHQRAKIVGVRSNGSGEGIDRLAESLQAIQGDPELLVE